MDISNSINDSVNQSLAADPKALESLSARAGHDPKAAVREVSQQFEAMFMNSLLKTMRETHFDDEDQSSEMQTYRGLLDQQMVQSMTSGSGMGLARVLQQQISKLANLPDDGQTVLPNSLVTGVMPMPSRVLRAYMNAQGVQASGTGTDLMNQSVAPAGAKSFVQQMMPQATKAAGQLGVAPEVLVAHAALESGWGRRAIHNPDGTDSHNLFGIKAGADWQGARTQVMTTEYVNGVAQKKADSFRSYGSYQEAFADYANVLSSSPRYHNVLNQGRNIQGFAQGLQSGGYATDPRYARKLIDVMSSLAQYSA